MIHWQSPTRPTMFETLTTDPISEATAATYAWAFGQGVLVDLTPCVYPLIPITVAVFGARGVSRGRAMFLASAYVLGMATLYTSLGVLVALSGAAFGTWLGNPWVVIPIAALLVALSASMFGAFDVQLPASLQTRLNTVGGAGPVGAFLMGLVSGLISAPCTGPVLLALLAYIAKSSAAGGSLFYAGSLLFVYALGMGTLFFAVALGASLFRPGPWMESVKSVFGIALIVMAFWFLRPISGALEDFVVDPRWGLWIGMLLAVSGLALGAVHLSFKDPGTRVRKGITVALAVVGSILALNHVLYVPPMTWHEVRSADELVAALDDAGDRPVLIDFAAKWCAPCLEMEKLTFHDPRIEPRLAGDFHLVKVDVTDPTEAHEDLKTKLRSGTLPSILLYASASDLRDAASADHEAWPEPTVRLTTFVPAEAFLEHLDAI